jgi:hypothetical protein
VIQPIRPGLGAGIVLGGGLLLLAFLLCRSGLGMYRQAEATNSWPSTTGKIVSAKEIRTEAWSRQRARYRYSSRISYRYAVNDKQYTSSQISTAKAWDEMYSHSTGASDAAYEGTWLAKYPEGKTVVVYYNPRDPTDALLERDEYWLSFALFALAGIAGLVGAAVIRAGFSRRHELD